MSDEKNPVVTGSRDGGAGRPPGGPGGAAASAEDAGGPGADELDDEFDDDEYERRHAEVDYGRVEFSYETREADVLDGVEVSDRKNRVDAHRNFQLLGVFVVIWMFWGDLFKNNGTQTLVSWVMVIAALALLFLILKFPANNNHKYAARLKEHSPRFELAATPRRASTCARGAANTTSPSPARAASTTTRASTRSATTRTRSSPSPKTSSTRPPPSAFAACCAGARRPVREGGRGHAAAPLRKEEMSFRRKSRRPE